MSTPHAALVTSPPPPRYEPNPFPREPLLHPQPDPISKHAGGNDSGNPRHLIANLHVRGSPEGLTRRVSSRNPSGAPPTLDNGRRRLDRQPPSTSIPGVSSSLLCVQRAAEISATRWRNSSRFSNLGLFPGGERPALRIAARSGCVDPVGTHAARACLSSTSTAPSFPFEVTTTRVQVGGPAHERRFTKDISQRVERAARWTPSDARSSSPLWSRPPIRTGVVGRILAMDDHLVILTEPERPCSARPDRISPVGLSITILLVRV